MNTVFTPQSSVVVQSEYVSKLQKSTDHIAAAGGEKIYLLDPTNLQSKLTLPGHAGKTEDFNFFEGDSNLIASVGIDNTCQVWDIRINQPSVHTFKMNGEPIAVAATIKGRSQVAVGVDKKVEIFDLHKGKKRYTFKDVHANIVSCITFHPYMDHMILSSGDDNLVCQLDVRMCNEDEGVPWVVNNEDNVREISVIGDSAEEWGVVTASTTDVIRIWSKNCANLGEFTSIRDNEDLKDEDTCGYIVSLISEGSRSFAIGASAQGQMGLFHINKDQVQLWSTFNPITAEASHKGVVRSALSMKNDRMVSADETGKVIIWAPQEESTDGDDGTEPST